MIRKATAIAMQKYIDPTNETKAETVVSMLILPGFKDDVDMLIWNEGRMILATDVDVGPD